MIEKTQKISIHRHDPQFEFRELLDSVYDAILITGTRGDITEANMRAEEFFMLDKDELAGRSIRNLISGLDDGVFGKVFESLEDHKHLILDAYCVRSNGDMFPAEIAVHKIFLTDECQLCFSIRNTSARKEAEGRLAEAHEDLLRAEKIKVRMNTITTLAHEINNPLQTLLSMVEIDRNERYAGPLKRIVGVIKELRSQEELKTVSYAGTAERFEIPSSELAPSNAGHLLIADDEVAIQSTFKSILELEIKNLKVECAGDGREALGEFAAKHHAIIILDVAMPVMNGEETFWAIKKICEEKKWEMPAIIFCTGFTPPKSIMQVIDEEYLHHAYLPKPITSNKLVAVVKERLRGHSVSHSGVRGQTRASIT